MANYIEIANSVSDFSGTQGQNNWYYGYYDGPFNSSDFQLMTQFGSDLYPVWTVSAGTYWTSLGDSEAHGNGIITSGGRLAVEQWAVRRYVSEVDGTIKIEGNLSKYTANGGNGVEGHIIVDGQEIWNQYILGNDTVGVDYKININVKKGSKIDLVLDPY